MPIIKIKNASIVEYNLNPYPASASALILPAEGGSCIFESVSLRRSCKKALRKNVTKKPNSHSWVYQLHDYSYFLPAIRGDPIKVGEIYSFGSLQA